MKQKQSYILPLVLWFCHVGSLYAQVDSSGRMLKLDLPATLLGNVSVAYEMQYAPYKSWELGLVVFLPRAGIQIGANQLNGFMVRAGQKNYPQTKYMKKRGIENPAMEGLYVRRDLFFLQRNSRYQVDYREYVSSGKYVEVTKDYYFHEIGFGAIYNLGYQKKLGNRTKFDVFFGMGMAYSYEQNNFDYNSYQYYNENPNNNNIYGALLSFNNITFVLQGGLKIGYEL